MKIVTWDWIWLEQFHSFLVSFHPPPLFFFQPTSSLLFLFLWLLSLSPTLPLNYGSGGAAAYVRAEAASAKQLSNVLGRRLPMAGQVQEKSFLFIECRLLDFGIMPKMPRKKGHEIRREKAEIPTNRKTLRQKICKNRYGANINTS